MPPFDVGRLRDRVTVQARTQTNNGGAVVDTFTARAASSWGTTRLQCQVQTATAGNVERVFGSQSDVVATHLVTLPTWSVVTHTDRVLWHRGSVGADRVLEIRGITELDADRRYMVLACEERGRA